MFKLIGWIFSFGMSNQIVKQSPLSNQDKGNENKKIPWHFLKHDPKIKRTVARS